MINGSNNKSPPVEPPMIEYKLTGTKTGVGVVPFVYIKKENDDDLSNLGVNTVIV